MKTKMLAMIGGAILFYALTGVAFSAVLFQEDFEDANFEPRGWYDNLTLKLSTTEHFSGARSVEYHFPQGEPVPETSGGAIRHLFTESDSVYISYYVKHSANWVGSGVDYHPHEVLLLTNLDDKYAGPSRNYLTAYIEENGGRVVLGLQDALNIDQTRIGVDLRDITEQRAVAGCNGYYDNDGSGPEDCYGSAGSYRNWKTWTTSTQYFRDTAGAYYKGDWHHIEVYFKLNTISGGKGVADGIMQYWYDGTLIINHNNVMYRTGQYPNMRFNQFQIAPWIGDGSPVDQTMWIDNLRVETSRPTTTPDATAPSPPRNLRVQ